MAKQKKTIEEEINQIIEDYFEITEKLSDNELWKFCRGKQIRNFLYGSLIEITYTFLQRFIEETKVKEKIYEEEIKKFRKDDSIFEGEFYEQFLDGYNYALKKVNQKQAQWLKENF